MITKCRCWVNIGLLRGKAAVAIGTSAQRPAPSVLHRDCANPADVHLPRFHSRLMLAQ